MVMNYSTFFGEHSLEFISTILDIRMRPDCYPGRVVPNIKIVLERSAIVTNDYRSRLQYNFLPE